ncbi:5-formyltetrahydrofolate cyclo-ligase [Paenibacillus sp. HJL G12]|uniref:5-formyltetrahydrofolate cyclo-ligase n=1 Tax=Paenibacillus dendrobii TaxID=2691084 RepID=A0A7X3IKW7_9BACL|nr:5-formyltetrahydrofolate cyclo-ligase [Paenibacillus dendrobii]MWV44505.1 5-formyltetrahydrofolate cyclo-ligase [Paenibacillus dendrobii]
MNGENSTIHEIKAQLRTRMSQVRSRISAELHRDSSDSACRHAAMWLNRESVRSMLIYVPFRNELDTKPLIEEAWQAGIEVYVPRCRREDCSMTLHRLKQWDELNVGTYGILEPEPQQSPAMADNFLPEAVFMPGLAFDRQGGRLGYGGGYYDRLYERFWRRDKMAKLPVWVGIGFDAQVIEQVPMEQTDARLQFLITEQDVYEMNKEAEKWN